MNDAVSYALEGAKAGDHLVLQTYTHEVLQGAFIALRPEAVCLQLGKLPMWINRNHVAMARVILTKEKPDGQADT